MTVVVAAVLERDQRILICQRTQAQPHPRKWEFPGGKVEAGEAPQSALVRELREELAIHARIGPEITRYEYAYPGKQAILLIFYAIEEFAPEPVNRVFERIVWEEPVRLSLYDFLEGDGAFLARFER